MTRLLLPSRYVSLVLLIVDLASLIFLFNIVYSMRIGDWRGDQWTLVWPTLFTLASLYVLDTYRTDAQIAGMQAPVRAIIAVAFAGVLSSVAAYVSGYWGNLFGRGVLPIALFLFSFWAYVVRFFAAKWTRQQSETVCWLVLGAGESASFLWKDFSKTGHRGKMHFLAKNNEEYRESQARGLPEPVGTMQCINAEKLKTYAGIIISSPPPLPDDLVQLLMQIRYDGKSVYDLTDFYERFWFKVPILHLKNGWIVFAYAFDLLQDPLGVRLKRILDVVISTALFLLFSPLMIIIVLLIRLDNPGPAIFHQKRVGEGRREFTIYKFRTMRMNAEENGPQWTNVNDTRVTRIGRVLRITHLDELPQLWNVIRGDMSFIGPRPERAEFTKMFESQIPYYDSRYLVKPGITGWAQVMYPYGASVEDAHEKLQYDLYYIKHYSLLLDIAILFKTVRIVLLGKGR